MRFIKLNKKLFLIITIILLFGSQHQFILIVGGENSKLEISTSDSLGEGYRYNIQGWVYLHIEGDPYERGYQYGYLVSSEIMDTLNRWINWQSTMKFKDLFTIKNKENLWKIYKNRAINIFYKQVPDEYREELRGITDGLIDKGVKLLNHEITYEDIVTSQFIQEIQYNFEFAEKRFHPLQGISYFLKSLVLGQSALSNQGHCNAFIATGDATEDGGIVVGHSTIFNRYIAQRCNLILDIQPTNGYRFVMTCPPGSIWSQEDYYQNEKGIILTETELVPQGPYNKNGIPKGARSRRAIQYSDSIDDVINILMEGNNGLIPNEWLIGDTKTGEIASLQQALYNTPVKRTYNGFYWSRNYPHNLMVQKELYGPIQYYLYRLGLKLFPEKFSDPYAEKFEEIKKEYYGKINTYNSKEILADPLLSKPVTDAKISNSKLMERMGFIGFIGNPNGDIWIPFDEVLKKYPGVTEQPACGWVNIYPLESKLNLGNNGVNITKDNQSKVIWEYKIEEFGNLNYSSNLIEEDIVYSSSSTGMIYSLNISNGQLKWSRKIGNISFKSVAFDDMIYFTSDVGLYAVDKETGNIKWKQKIEGISSKPTIINNILSIGCKNGDIFLYELENGNFIWSYNFPESITTIQKFDNKLYLTSGKTCYNLDINNKEIKKIYQAESIIISAVFQKNNCYFCCLNGNICSIDIKTGDSKWSFQTGWSIVTTPALSDGMVFVGSLDNKFYALNQKNGNLKWYFKCRSAIHSSPTVYGEYVFIGSDDGRLYALNKVNGTLIWSFKPGYSIDNNINNYITTPILSDPITNEGIVVLGVQGKIVGLDAQTFEKPFNDIKTHTNDSNWIFLFFTIIFIMLAILIILNKLKRTEIKNSKNK